MGVWRPARHRRVRLALFAGLSLQVLPADGKDARPATLRDSRSGVESDRARRRNRTRCRRGRARLPQPLDVGRRHNKDAQALPLGSSRRRHARCRRSPPSCTAGTDAPPPLLHGARSPLLLGLLHVEHPATGVLLLATVQPDVGPLARRGASVAATRSMHDLAGGLAIVLCSTARRRLQRTERTSAHGAGGGSMK